MSDDYEKYEIECKRIREANKRLLEEFAVYLQQSGLSGKTIDKHTENIEFYINEFLLYEETQEPQEGVCRVGRFLGYWFIKKAMWSSASSIKSNAASLKRFYTYLHEREMVSQADLDSLKREIRANMPEWLARLARYDDPSITELEEIWGW